THLRLPAGVVGGELVNEQDRGTASRFLIVEPRRIAGGGVRHKHLPVDAAIVARRSPDQTSSIAGEGPISCRRSGRKSSPTTRSRSTDAGFRIAPGLARHLLHARAVVRGAGAGLPQPYHQVDRAD